MPALDLRPTPAFPATRPGVRAVPLPGAQWRVTRASGDVLGYIDELPESAGGRRFRSRRMIPRQARFVELGDYLAQRERLPGCDHFLVSGIMKG